MTFTSKSQVLAIVDGIFASMAHNGNHYAFAVRSATPSATARGAHIKSVVRVTRADGGYWARVNVYVRTSGSAEASETVRGTARKVSIEAARTFVAAELVTLTKTHPDATLDLAGPTGRKGTQVIDTTSLDALPDTDAPTVPTDAPKVASKAASK